MTHKSKRKKQPIFRFEQSHLKKYPWLFWVKNAYETADQAIRRLKKITKNIACRAGCDACCQNSEVNVFAGEICVISWYAAEIMDQATQDKLIKNIKAQSERRACPFLCDRRCAIYPVRPLNCRQYHVLNRPCAPGEDIAKDRPRDICIPANDEDTYKAAVYMLKGSYLNFSLQQCAQVVADGNFLAFANLLHRFNFLILIDTIEMYRQIKK